MALVRQAENSFLNRLTSGFGDANTAQYVQQQLLMDDRLDRYGRRVFAFEDDFLNPASATASDYHAYTSTDDSATGTNAFQDKPGGIYNVVTAAADNDYHAMSTVAENWKFQANKPLWFEIIFRLSEATTGNDAAFWMGLTDTLTTGGFQANAAGPLASYDGALWFKNEDGTTLNFENSNATTQDTEADIVSFTSNTWTRLGFYFDGTATTSSITPYYSVTGGTGDTPGSGIWNLTKGPVTTITLSGLEEMHVVFGVKAGPGGSAETLQVDYVSCAQVR